MNNSINMALGIVACFVPLCVVINGQLDYSIVFQEPSDCKQGSYDGWHEFFDFSMMACVPCSQNDTYQVSNGFECFCRDVFRKQRTVTSEGVISWMCIPCPNDQVATLDGWGCIACSTAEPEDVCPDCPDLDYSVTADRDLDGSPLDSSIRQCVECVASTHPDLEGRRCEYCPEIQAVLPSTNASCVCPNEVDGFCFKSPDDVVPDNPTVYAVTYENEMEVQSALFVNNIRGAHAACTNYTRTSADRLDYSNLAACQMLANLCVLTLYNSGYEPPHVLNDACSLHLRLMESFPDSSFEPHADGSRAQQDRIQEWKANMPWLWYREDQADDIIENDVIPTLYKSGDFLQLVAAKYSVEGDFVGYVDVTQGELQVCKKPKKELRNVFRFGFQTNNECRLSIKSIFEDEDLSTYFYDLYLEYTANGNKRLLAVPVMIRNYEDRLGERVNEEDDKNLWQLVRRFFLVDRVAGFEDSDDDNWVAHYARKMSLHIRLQEAQGQGRIFTPYLEITYEAVTYEQALNDEYTSASFAVYYTMPVDGVQQDLTIAIGVISALATVITAFQTSTWMRRQGLLAIECASLLKFCVILCGNLASGFFVSILGFALWWFIFYKAQDSMYIVPTDDANYLITAYLASAFVLGFIDIVHLVFNQVTADVFLIDWEKGQTRDKHAESKEGAPSAFRTVFVANEWQEIQTLRKVTPAVTLILLVGVLVFGEVQNLARFDNNAVSGDDPRGDYSLVFRFALGAVLYMGIAVLQWLLYLVLWSRFKEHAIYNFVDLCSMCNVSVFIMTHAQYGHYVHGRSIHGRADVDLKRMAEYLNREQEDLCSDRGLVPGTSQQTFEVFVPRKLRAEYQRVLQRHVLKITQAPPPRHSSASRLSVDLEQKLQAYTVLNQFLQCYIDHNLKNINYRVVDRSLYEKILDTEIIQDFNSGFFYIDHGHSFDRALFYGQERRLLLFNILTFCLMDLITSNFALAAFLTFLLDEVTWRVRQAIGRSNISKKTLIDDAFLL